MTRKRGAVALLQPDEKLEDRVDAPAQSESRPVSRRSALATAVIQLRDVRHVGAIAQALATRAISDFTDVVGAGPRHLIETSEGTTEIPSVTAVLELQALLLHVADAARARIDQLLAGGPKAVGPIKLQLKLFMADEDAEDEHDWSARAVPKRERDNSAREQKA